jgi:DNA-binding response OmpR family regulator
MSATTELTVLLAEDDDGHASLVQRNLKRAGIANAVLRFRDGAGLLEYTAGLDEGRARGHLALLDIRMPGIDGVETLRRIRANPRISTMPVIMLSTTDDPREIYRCHEFGCSSYIVKPVEYPAFVAAIHSLGLFLLVVSLPSTPVPRDRGHP